MAGFIKTAVLAALLTLGYVKAQEYTLSGNVKDDETLLNIPGAVVQTPTKTDTTDEFGNWEITDTVVGIDEEPGQPKGYTLSQNYPNPFNPSTKISFTTPRQINVNFEIYNVTGEQIIKTQTERPKGTSTINIQGLETAGIYFYRITAGKFTDTKKMVQLDGSQGKPNITWTYGGQKTTSLGKPTTLEEQIPLTISKEGYKTDSSNVEQITQTLQTYLNPDTYDLNVFVKAFDVDGYPITVEDMEKLTFKWSYGGQDDYLHNGEGFQITKTIPSPGINLEAEVIHYSNKHLTWSLLASKAQQLERLAQNADGNQNLKFPLEVVEGRDTVEIYWVNKSTEHPYIEGATINIDSDTTIGMVQGRPLSPFISGFESSEAADSVDAILLTVFQDNGVPVDTQDLDYVEERFNECIYLISRFPGNGKHTSKIKNIYRIDSFNDPLWTAIQARGGDNASLTYFKNVPTPSNGVTIASDGTQRMLNNFSQYASTGPSFEELYAMSINGQDVLGISISQLAGTGGDHITDYGKKVAHLSRMFETGTILIRKTLDVHKDLKVEEADYKVF